VTFALLAIAVGCGARSGLEIDDRAADAAPPDAEPPDCGGEHCYEGPHGTRRVGACTDGTRECTDAGIECVGWIGPREETCNGEDDDCDRETDDIPGAGDPCETGTPGVCGDGTWGCDGREPACLSPVSPGDRTEICANGLDDDCDGATDEPDCSACTSPDPSCHEERREDRCYFFCTGGADWWSALAACNRAGYHLLTIDDAPEDDWADETIDAWARADGLALARTWFGFDDLDEEGQWIWENGTEVAYVNWYSGEPNNLGDGENCGTINRFDPEVGWNDQHCEEANPWICEE
jgi:hypothetical protein